MVNCTVYTMNGIYDSVQKKRISTFFLISDEKIISTLSLDYTERETNADLSVFVKKVT